MNLLSIPSPPSGVWEIGGFPLRAYALCIIAGVIVGVIIGSRRWVARGGKPDTVETVAVIAVPFGIVGARIYHVITDYQLYFGPGRDPIDALKIWNGGLGIWGGVALGAVGAYLVARHRGVRFAALADAMAPGIVVAQGIGRLGNWFNQELFGRPTDLPWALQIDRQHRPEGFEQYETFHPTFLYELIWNFGVAAVLIWADRKFKLGRGKVFVGYIVLYTAGRFWIEALRIDKVNEIGGFRLNNYTSVIVFVLALAWLIWLFKKKPGREAVVEGIKPGEDPAIPVGGDESAASTSEAKTIADAGGGDKRGRDKDDGHTDGADVDGAGADRREAEATDGGTRTTAEPKVDDGEPDRD